jgi:hypothetical protein
LVDKAVVVGLVTGIAFITLLSSIGNTFFTSVLYPPAKLEAADRQVSESDESILLRRLADHQYEYRVSIATLSSDPGAEKEILFSRSANFGESFSEPVNLSNTTTLSISPAIVSDDENVYAIWFELPDTQDRYRSYFRASHDYGETFGKTMDLSIGKVSLAVREIKAVQNMVFIAGEDRQTGSKIYFRFSEDNGRSFSDAYLISNSANYGAYVEMVPSTDGKMLFLVWVEYINGSRQVMFRSITFSSDHEEVAVNEMNRIMRLSYPNEIAEEPLVVTTEKNVYVGWLSSEPYRPSEYDASGNPAVLKPKTVMFRSSNDGGYTFGNAWTLSSNVFQSHSMKMAAEGDHVYVVWNGYSPHTGSNVFYRQSADGGQTFARTHYLLSDYTQYPSPVLVVSGDIVYLSGQAFGVQGRTFVISYDGGRTFTNRIAAEP